MEGTFGVVFQRRRSAESGHDRVADELLDGAARGLDLGLHGVVEALEERPGPFRILRRRERGRADEVGEQHRRQLAFLACLRRLLDRCTADMTEARSVGERGSARGATGHARILTCRGRKS